MKAEDVLGFVEKERFEEALASLESFLGSLAPLPSGAKERAIEPFTRYTPIFGHARDFVASAPFFERLVASTAGALGAEHPHVYRLKRTLAGVLAGTDRLPEAIRLQEEVLAFFSPRVAADHPGLLAVRESLAIYYRNAGRDAEAEALVSRPEICAHLSPLLDDLRSKGARVVSVGKPWSERCHVWVYLNGVLDVEALGSRLHLADCVKVHDHRGTHDGAEKGFVCTKHDDGVMGPHPDLAAGAPTFG